jgi:hypothetical protein
MSPVSTLSKYLATPIMLSAVAMCSVALAGCEDNKCAQMGESLDVDKAEVHAMLQPQGCATEAGSGTPDDAGGAAITDDAGGAAPTDDAGGAAPTDDAGATAMTDDAGGAASTDDAGTPEEAADGVTASGGAADLPCPSSGAVSAYVWRKYHYVIDAPQIGTPLDEGATCLYPIRSAFCSE